MEKKRLIDQIWDAIRDPFYEPADSQVEPIDLIEPLAEEPAEYDTYVYLWIAIAPDDPNWLDLGGEP